MTPDILTQQLNFIDNYLMQWTVTEIIDTEQEERHLNFESYILIPKRYSNGTRSQPGPQLEMGHTKFSKRYSPKFPD